MKLDRDGDGVVLLEGLPIGEWFRAHDVVPAQDRFRGVVGGRDAICLLTALGYAALGHDPDVLYRTMNGEGGVSAGHPTTTVILAGVIGITPGQAADLEGGWTDCRELRREPPGLWDLGFAAWEQAKGATDEL